MFYICKLLIIYIIIINNVIMMTMNIKVMEKARLYFSLQAFMIWKNAADILTSIEYIQSVDINLIATEKGIVNDLRRMLYVRN